MKSLLVLLLGLTAGLAGYFGTLHHALPAPGSTPESVAWLALRESLGLDPAQEEQARVWLAETVRRQHGLDRELCRLQSDLDALEEARLTRRPVDFLRFHALLQREENLTRQTAEAQAAEWAALARTLSPAQREMLQRLLRLPPDPVLDPAHLHSDPML